MDVNTFYAATSALCFTLLGFWWVVVQFRHAEMTGTVTARRFAFLVSLYFLLPGLISLAAIIAAGGILWRFTFGAAGIAGILAVFVATRHTSATGTIRTLARWSWVAIPLYAILTIIAVAPDIARNGLKLEPLQVEGLVLVALMFVGIMFAWLLFTEPMDTGTPTTTDGI
jgi:hypothetical protein